MKRKQRILVFVVSAMVVCLLLAALFATVMDARAEARRAAVPDQVKRLSLAPLMYARDFEGAGRPVGVEDHTKTPDLLMEHGAEE